MLVTSSLFQLRYIICAEASQKNLFTKKKKRRRQQLDEVVSAVARLDPEDCERICESQREADSHIARSLVENTRV